jgi:hypothetical protein
MFAIVDPVKQISSKESSIYLQYFGFEDTIYNHVKYLIKINKGGDLTDSYFNIRRYSLVCIKSAYCLTLSFSSIDRMK